MVKIVEQVKSQPDSPKKSDPRKALEILDIDSDEDSDIPDDKLPPSYKAETIKENVTYE